MLLQIHKQTNLKLYVFRLIPILRYLYYSFRTGANPNSKRKAIWTVEDVTKIEITKKSEILKPIDLYTAPHILISSAKSINKQDGREQLIEPTGNNT